MQRVDSAGPVRAFIQCRHGARGLPHSIRLLLQAKPTTEQGYAMACFHYQTARYAEADVLCRQILRAVPGHRDALLLAILAQRSGRKAEGDEWLRQAVESKEFSITLSDKLDSRPRWSPHAKISAMLEPGLERYGETLRSFEHYLPWLEKITFDNDPQQPRAPYWNNVWLPCSMP